MTDDGSKASSGWRVWFAGQTIFARATIAAIVMGAYAAGVVAIELYWLGGMGSVGAGFHGILGLTLGLLLVLRTNTSYDRWWEGRKLWGELVTRSRSLARQLQTLTAFDEPARHDDPADPRTAMIRRTIAHAHALRHELRDSDPGADVAPWLSDADRAGFAASRLGSEWLLRRNGHELGALMRAGRLDPRLAAEMDATLSGLAAVAASCERIRRTPLPFAYTLLLHRTATLYCYLLPFGLVDTIGAMTPFVVAIVAYTFFGLDAVGDEIEEPFGLAVHYLPLTVLCRTIEINLREALEDPELP